MAYGSLRTLVFLFIFSVASPAVAQKKMTLILDWFINPNHGPIIIAKEKGYFTQQGLDVKIIQPTDPADPPKMVAAHRADLAISYQPQLHLQVHAGMPLRRVGTLIATPLNCVLTLKDSPIKKIADLKGQKVGFSVAGVDKMLFSSLLQLNGLSIKDVIFVNVGWSLATALMSGQVDAVTGATRNFETKVIESKGFASRCFYLEEEGLLPYDELIYVANPETMDKEMILHFLIATEKAAQFIVNHPQESWSLFSNTSSALQNEMNEKSWIETFPRFSLSPAALDSARYQRFETFLYKIGAIEEIYKTPALAVDIGANQP
ncbi:MAG: ABC transporter substrate-binding protein [Alphaproteobacteria bacterium]|nr:ABC transporter substrate-binding protein [Alphaproteobacteria bacterium]